MKTAIRPASVADLTFMATCFAESSGGVWPAVWEALAHDDESWVQSASRYLVSNNDGLSLRTTVIADNGDRALGAMATYQERAVSKQVAEVDNPTPSARTLPASLQEALQPYRELSDTDSWFIAELCVSPEARAQGLGSRLLELAVQQAQDQTLPRLTLRVFSENSGAVNLYKRHGFAITDQRAVLPHPAITMGGDVYLMSRPV